MGEQVEGQARAAASAPPPRPSKIVAIHVNYRSRAAERGRDAPVPVVLPEAAVDAVGRRRGRRAADGLRAAGLRGRDRARHRAHHAADRRRRRVGPRGARRRRQRPRRLRPPLRRPGLERPLQGLGRLHTARPADPGRRARPGRPAHRHPGERRGRPGGPHLRAHLPAAGPRGRPVPGHDARARRRDPDRHPGRLPPGAARRRGGGRGVRPLHRPHDHRRLDGAALGRRSGAEAHAGRPGRRGRRQRAPPGGADRRAAVAPVVGLHRHPDQPAAAPRHPLDVLHRPGATAARRPGSSATRTRCATSRSGRTCWASCRPGSTRRSGPWSRSARTRCW